MTFEQIYKIRTDGAERLAELEHATRAIPKEFDGAACALNLFDKTLGALGGALGGVTAAMAGLAAGAAAIGTLAGVALDAAVAVGKTAEEQLNLAERTGLTVREVGLFSAAATVANVNTGALVASMRTLSQALADNSDEGKRGKRALAELGIQAHDTLGNVRPMGDLWLDISRAIGSIESPADRSRVAISLLGRGALELLPLLRGNFRELLGEVEGLGVAFTESGAKKAAAFDDALDKLGLKWEALKRSFGEKVIGVIEVAFPDFLDPKKGPSAFEQYLQFWWKSTGIPAITRLNKQIADYAKAGVDLATGAAVQAPGAVRANIQDARDISRRDLIEGALGRLRSDDTLEQKARKAREEFEKLARELKSSQALDPAAEIAAVQRAKARADALQRQVEAQKDLQQAVRAVEALEKQAYLSASSGLERVIRLREIELSQLGKNVELRQRIIQATNLEIEKEIAKARKIARAETAKVERAFEGDENRADRFSGRTFERGLKESIAEDEKAVRNLSRALDVLDRGEEAAIKRRADKALRVAELTAGPGEELRAVERAFQTRLALARELFEVSVRRADRELDAEEKLLRLAEAREQREAEIDQARQGRELALLELRKRSLDEYRETAGKVFDSLTASGGGGLRDFFQGQLKILERQIFVNASSGIFQQLGGVLGKVGEASGLGKLLSGTIFDPKNTQVQERTVTSMDKLRVSVDRLTGRIGGSVVPAGAGDIQSGLPGLLGLPPGIFGPGGTPPFLPSTTGTGTGVVSSSPGGLSRFLGGLLGFGGGNPLGAIFTPSGESVNLGNGRATTFSTAERVGAAAGVAAAVAAGTAGVLGGIKQGGARGTIQAIGSAAGTAAALDPEPISKAVLSVVAISSGLINSLFGDPKKKRDEEITREIEQNRFREPVARDLVTDLYGNTVDYDRRGQVRVIQNTTVNVSAIDVKSIMDRKGDLADAVNAAFRQGHGLQDSMRESLGFA